MAEIWEYLELKIYGEVQPRVVDDIMFLLWSAFVIIAYLIGRLSEHKKEKHKEENNEIPRTEPEKKSGKITDWILLTSRICATCAPAVQHRWSFRRDIGTRALNRPAWITFSTCFLKMQTMAPAGLKRLMNSKIISAFLGSSRKQSWYRFAKTFRSSWEMSMLYSFLKAKTSVSSSSRLPRATCSPRS